jgi:hypothetical protein
MTLSHIQKGVFMKNFLFLVTFLSLSAVAAEGKLVKACTTTVASPGDTKFKIFSKNSSEYFARITQKVKGHVSTYEDVSEVSTDTVRAGLTGDLVGDHIDELNLAENLVSHAMALTQDPDMVGVFSSGMDLKNVRSATVYTFGEAGNIGMLAIVEAKDESGQAMGSFFGGVLLAPCK